MSHNRRDTDHDSIPLLTDRDGRYAASILDGSLIAAVALLGVVIVTAFVAMWACLHR